jgi:hypothetical protein
MNEIWSKINLFPFFKLRVELHHPIVSARRRQKLFEIQYFYFFLRFLIFLDITAT